MDKDEQLAMFDRASEWVRQEGRELHRQKHTMDVREFHRRRQELIARARQLFREYGRFFTANFS